MAVQAPPAAAEAAPDVLTPTPAEAATSGPVEGVTDTEGEIAFVSKREGSRDIYVMNLDGTGLRRLTDDPASESSPAWSPDGTRIAYAWSSGPPDFLGDIYVINADGSGKVNVSKTKLAWNRAPAWSPDGTRIAFHSLMGSGSIRIVDPDNPVDDSRGLELTTATHLTGTAPLGVSIAWSPDGTRIAFSAPTSEPLQTGTAVFYHDFDIFVMNADGSDVRNVTNNDIEEYEPAWSPDGERILFAALDGGSLSMFMMSADGPGRAPLTRGPRADPTQLRLTPAWSPDGQRIAFTLVVEGNRDVYVTDSDGSNSRRLTQHPEIDTEPAWRPTR